MKELTPEQIQKLQKIETTFIDEKMNREPGDGKLKFSDINSDLARLYQKNKDNPEKKNELESIAKSHYKKEFCDDLIENFDDKMKEIGHDSLDENDKDNHLKGMKLYSHKLGIYNTALMTEQVERAMFGKDYDERPLNQDWVNESEQSVTSSVHKQSISLEALSTEDRPQDPNDLDDEVERRGLFSSVADFFAAVNRFLITGLVSWWTGAPLDKVEEMYDMEKAGDSDDMDEMDNEEVKDKSNDYDDEMSDDDDEIDIGSRGRDR
jgi:hypothetical protein